MSAPLDLTIADPVRAGLVPDPATILRALSDPAGLAETDDDHARAAIALDWRALGVSIDSARVVLAAGRAAAYARALAALCEPHDEIVVVTPGADSLASIARSAGVHLTRAPLAPGDRGLVLDVAAIYDAVTDRTRAIALAAPHAPTGLVLTAELADALLALELPLLCDETLARHPLEAPPDHLASLLSLAPAAPVLAIAGLETLPALGLAWIGVHGPGAGELTARLEATDAVHGVVPAPLVAALPRLLASAPRTRVAIASRVRRNLDALRARTPDLPPVEGGWLACLRPQRDTAAVLTHPGVLYDLPPDWAVISLLTEPATFDAALTELLP